MARMRAIETGRYLARAANTGISGIVDPYGRVVQPTPLFEQAVVVGEVRFLDGHARSTLESGTSSPGPALVVALGLWAPERARAGAVLASALAAPVRRSACRPSIVKSSSAATKTS